MNVEEITKQFVKSKIEIKKIPHAEMCISGFTRNCELKELLKHCRHNKISEVFVSPMTTKDFLLMIYEDHVRKIKKTDHDFDVSIRKSDSVKCCEALAYCLNNRAFSIQTHQKLQQIKEEYIYAYGCNSVCSVVISVAKHGAVPRYAKNEEWVDEVMSYLL